MMSKPRTSIIAKASSQQTQLFTDLLNVQRSTFTLTFVVEIMGIDVWHDCNEGWLDLGPCSQGIKFTYRLYYGHSYEVDILIWPHTAKIWHGENSGWVRSWQFLEHRFIAFSISHALPVRVTDFLHFEATVTPTYGLPSLGSKTIRETELLSAVTPGNLTKSNTILRAFHNLTVSAVHNLTDFTICRARNDKNTEVYLPKLEFGQRRYFAPVVETLEEPLHTYLRRLIWNAVVEFIPMTFLDGTFDVPLPVTDIRHQDAVIEYVQNLLLNRSMEDLQKVISHERTASKGKMGKRDSKSSKLEISLPGAAILAGTGRIVPFKISGDQPTGTGEIVVLISSTNLPAQDDLPVLFVNVGKLFDVPLKELRKHRITHLYTRWILKDEKHDSETRDLKSLKLDKENIIDFNDHYALPLGLDDASKIAATFLDTPFEIQLRGQRLSAPLHENPKYFGYEKGDRDFGTAVPPKPVVEDLDPLIAVTKIDARQLAKCLQTFIRGEYPLFPPPTSVADSLNREAICTNDINAIRASVVPKLVIPSYVILQAQMTLEVSMGIVGCRPRRLQHSFSRMFALISDPDSSMTLLQYVTEMNEELCREKEYHLLLSGFAIDTGDTVVFFLEGPRDGYILKVWGMTEDLYPKIKPVFSSSARYGSRMYSELLTSAAPFVVLKMFAPLGVILACPPVYVRTALPLPTRSCILKLGRLIASRFETPPCRAEMPSSEELRSFRLELCSPPHPPVMVHPDIPKEITKEAEANQRRRSTRPEGPNQSSVNWERSAKKR